MERTAKRSAVELFAALVLAAIVLLAIFGFIGYSFLRAADDVTTLGGHLSKSERAAIDKSDCAQLRSILPGWEANADSTTYGVEGVRAIVSRSRTLHCDPPLRSSFAD